MRGRRTDDLRPWLSRTLTALCGLVAFTTGVLPQGAVSAWAVIGACTLIAAAAAYLGTPRPAKRPPSEQQPGAGSAPDTAGHRQSPATPAVPSALPAAADGDVVAENGGSRFGGDSQSRALVRYTGMLAIGLPIVLRAGIVAAGPPLPYSLSGYYYSPLRDILVASLCVMGFLLLVSGGRDGLERFFSAIAGAGLLGTALFPVGPARPGSLPWTSDAHLVFIVYTMVSLAVMALLFTRADTGSRQLGGTGQVARAFLFRYPAGYRAGQVALARLHSACGWLILVSLILTLVMTYLPPSARRVTQWPFWFEAVALAAFGVSCLAHSTRRERGEPALTVPGLARLRLVYAREPLADKDVTSIFLAGPTPRRASIPSWRPAAITELAARWPGPEPLAVLIPESPDGLRAADYDDQVEWEAAARARATAILFWVPRDIKRLPGFTTNVEFGLDVTTGRAVLGCPPDCPDPERNRYLIWLARQHGVPVCETLAETVTAALDIVTAGCPS